MQKKIGKFEIVGELGRGAMGVVYRGKDPFIGRTVAIKTITGNFTDNPDLLERFYREARAAGTLQHPNIVTIYDMGEDNGTPYIAMELLEGEDLAEKVDREKEGGAVPLPASIKLGYIVQVCRALEFAHKRNVVHRDIKPANIRVTPEGTVKVVDFGIARLTDTSSTSSGMLIGTIDYMSPEQIRGEKVDGRADIWAVGVMSYEVLTYTKPFQGANITAVMFAIVSQEPKSIRELRPDLPVELDAVMRRIFKKEPGERYQNMEELLGELEPIVRRMQQESVGMLVTESETLFNSGELQRAKELLKQALVLDTSHLHAKTLLDKVNSAIRRSEVMPKLGELISEAEKQLAAGNFEEARRQADAALHVDSNYMPARDLLGKIKEAEIQLQVVQSGLREARQRLAEGGLTEAEQSLEKVLKTAPDNQEAQSLRKEIAEEKERRGRRRQLTEGVQKARQLWTGQQFDEALRTLDELQKSFPNETEVVKLLDAVRADKAQDEIQKTLAEARRLLTAQSFNESLAALDRLLQRYPNEAAAVKLRELVLQERGEHARNLRLQKEVESLKKLVNEEKFQDAISNGEALLKEFPGDFELSRLVEFARTQQAQKEKLLKRQARNQEINALVESGALAKAVELCQQALKEFPGDAEFKQRLEQVNTLQKEAKDRERLRLLDESLRNMQQLLEEGDVSGALEVGKQTQVRTGPHAELTRLIKTAEQKRSLRDLRRAHDADCLKVIGLLEDKKFEEAAKILRRLERDEIDDSRVGLMLRAAEDRRTPSRDDLAKWRGMTVQVPEEAEAADETSRTRVGPRPVPKPADAGAGTRVFRPESVEETKVQVKGPAAPAPPAAAPPTPADEITTIKPPAAAATPVVTPADEKTTIVPPVGEATTIKPPAVTTPVEEKTTIRPPKEEKKLDKKEQKREEERKQKERELEKERKKETAVAGPPVAVVPPVLPEVRETKAPAPQQTLAPAASVALPEIAPPKPFTPPVEERKEAPPRKPAFEEVVPAPAAEKKKGGMGLIIGGAAAAVALAVVLVVWKPWQHETPTGSTSTVTQPDSAASEKQARDMIAQAMKLPSSPTGADLDRATKGLGDAEGFVTSHNLGGDLLSTIKSDNEQIEKIRGNLAQYAQYQKQANDIIAQAMKLPAKQDYDGALKKLTEAENFVNAHSLGDDFLKRIKDDRANVETVRNDTTARNNLLASNTYYDSAVAAINGGQYDKASQALDQLQGVGKGAAHQDEIPTLRNQITEYKQQDQAFEQAKSMAQSSDLNSLKNAKQALQIIAQGGGRHAKDAAPLVTSAQNKMDQIVAGEYKAKLEAAQNAVLQAVNAKNKEAAQTRLQELQAFGSDPNFPASLRGELNSLVSSDNSKISAIAPPKAEPVTPPAAVLSASCTVTPAPRTKYTASVKAGQEMGQVFLDSDLHLISGGANCSLPEDSLTKGTWRLSVSIDTEGKVADVGVLLGDAGTASKIVAAAKSAWHFDPPKTNGLAVRTKAQVVVTVQ